MREINMKNAKFFVQPNKRKIVCIIENCEKDFITFIYQKTRMRVPFTAQYNGICDEGDWTPYLMPNSFVGIATCQEEDEWNEKIGKMVAFNRAKEKWGNSFFKRANRFMEAHSKIFEETCDTIDNFGKNLEENLKNRSNKIKQYFEEVSKGE